MAFERTSGAAGIGPEPAPTATTGSVSGTATDAMRLQILATEHWSLLASRALAWNESFTRAGMFLSALSGAIVALALVAQADQFGQGFRLFALVILPVVLFIGIGTLLRLGMANYHDSQCVIGMNRIRHEYIRLSPDLEPLFVMGTSDDDPGIDATMAIQPGVPLPVLMLSSTPLLVSVVNAVLFAAVGALLVMQVGMATGPAVAVGALAFIGAMGAQSWYATRSIAAVHALHRPLFPRSDDR